MIFVTGDTHRTIDWMKLGSGKFKQGKSLTKSDYLIITGDFGTLWTPVPDKTESYILNWYDSKPWVTLFIDGNHENHDRLEQLPDCSMFGSVVGKVTDSVYYLKRGHVYNIDGKSVWVMGGAHSIDKADRKEFINWWRQELPSIEQYEFGLQSLDIVNHSVDYIITHSCPSSVFDQLNSMYDLRYKQSGEHQLRLYLQKVADETRFRHWYFGHFHDDIDLGKFHLVFDRVVKLED